MEKREFRRLAFHESGHLTAGRALGLTGVGVLHPGGGFAFHAEGHGLSTLDRAMLACAGDVASAMLVGLVRRRRVPAYYAGKITFTPEPVGKEVTPDNLLASLTAEARSGFKRDAELVDALAAADHVPPAELMRSGSRRAARILLRHRRCLIEIAHRLMAAGKIYADEIDAIFLAFPADRQRLPRVSPTVHRWLDGGVTDPWAPPGPGAIFADEV